ncbi:MAG: hypothetical protein CO042_04745, partial [Parcubacteria group bacterium CG_4_9_14_0_2_um_filter_41_8]
MPIHLSTPINTLTRVGKVTSGRLAKLGIQSVKDLLEHYPSRFEDYSRILRTDQLADQDTGSVFGVIASIQVKKTSVKKMQLTEAFLDDGHGTIKIIWFNQPYIAQTLHEADRVSIAGTVERDFSGTWIMKNPNYEKVLTEKGAVHTSGLVPVYPATSGITQKQIRFLMTQALEAVDEFTDILPENIKQEMHLIDKNIAIRRAHLPESTQNYFAAIRRLKFEELFLIQLITEQSRARLKTQSAPTITFNEQKTKKLVSALPFKLTDDQRRVAWQILKDIQKQEPMNRLLQGEVGSGKTVVAAIAALNAQESGYQTAMMAPTEILAFQHFQTITNIFPDKTVALLTNKYARVSGSDNAKSDPAAGSDKTANSESDKTANESGRFAPSGLVASATGAKSDPAAGSDKTANSESGKTANESGRFAPSGLVAGSQSRASIKQSISDGSIHIIIGTHAIIQKDVAFNKLGLIIIDEQHRFGVNQRKELKNKCQMSNVKCEMSIPHLLSMTATPIPRSLALTLYGDLDISTIKQMPIGRKKIDTRVVEEKNRDKAYAFIRAKISAGQQVFVVCPLIEESDALGVASATEEYGKLKKTIFPDIAIGLLHGRLKTDEKERVMHEFKNGQTSVLVTTAVVEVGVDIPNASIMMI